MAQVSTNSFVPILNELDLVNIDRADLQSTHYITSGGKVHSSNSLGRSVVLLSALFFCPFFKKAMKNDADLAKALPVVRENIRFSLRRDLDAHSDDRVAVLERVAAKINQLAEQKDLGIEHRIDLMHLRQEVAREREAAQPVQQSASNDTSVIPPQARSFDAADVQSAKPIRKKRLSEADKLKADNARYLHADAISPRRVLSRKQTA